MLRSRTSVLRACAVGSLLWASSALALTVGEQVELTGSPLSTAEQRKPVAVYDPVNGVYVVAFEDYSNESTNFSDVLVTRVRLDILDATDGKLDGDLIVDDPEGIGLPLGINLEERQTTPAVAFNDSNNSVAVIWTDDRNGDTDIRGSRFLPSIGQFFGDVDISDGSTLNETEADVAWAQNTYLVAYRQLDVATGRFDVLGRRFFDDLSDFDPDPLDLNRTRIGGSVALTNLGNQFVITFEGGGDIWASTLGDLAQTGTSTPSAVSTSTTSETNVDVAPIGPAQISVVWRQRNASSDIFGDRLSAALTSVGPADFITTARNNQLIPKVAGDVNGALVVWQDFREGSNSPQVYGARLDSTGNLRDPLAFPLITLPAGAFEQNVVKGSGNDYLVFGVRRQIQQGTPEERIYVRLVRDEAPASMMSNEGDEEAPADGQTPMQLTFGPATGPEPMPGIEGLNVADGTLYTVTATSAPGSIIRAIQIIPEDADPNIPGHQVPAIGGSVGFDLTTCVMRDSQNACILADKGTVEVEVRSVEGTSVGTDTVEFLNVAPVASNVVLFGVDSMNAMPRTDDQLRFTYDYFDINGDPEMGTRVEWQRGDPFPDQFQTTISGVIGQPNVLTTIPANALIKGDTRKCVEGSDQGDRGDAWAVFIVPNDGSNPNNATREPPPGAPNPTNIITLQNSPPIVRGAEVCPTGVSACPLDFDPRTGTPLAAVFDDFDPDAIDDVEATAIEWSVRQPGDPDFTRRPDLDGAVQVPGTEVISGQIWKYEVTVSDGCTESVEPTESSTQTINNTAPTAVAEGPAEVPERSMVTLDATGSTDPDPNDTLTYLWLQTGGTEVTLDDATSAQPSFMAPSTVLGTSLVFRLTVSDGGNIPEGEQMQVVDTVAVQVRDLPNSDGDDLDDELEMVVGTDPMSNDTDADGLRDDEEVNPFTGELIVNPLDADSDDDGIRDGDEGRRRFGELEGAEWDGDPDGDMLINALDPDSDNDGIPDGIEAARTMPRMGGTSSPGGVPYAGTDGNFVADADPRTQTSPVDPDDDGDGFEDGEEDTNRNGRVDEGESDPNDPNDPAGGCSMDTQCGADEVCDTGTGMCVPADAVCTGQTLAQQGFECCVDANTPPEAEVCRNERWTCPPSSRQRNIGFCSGDDGSPVESGGCQALTAEGSSPLALLLLGLAGLFIRRRRC